MIQFNCSTCGEILANVILDYRKGRDIICAGDFDENIKRVKLGQLLDSLDIKKYCCRQKLSCEIRLIQLIDFDNK